MAARAALWTAIGIGAVFVLRGCGATPADAAAVIVSSGPVVIPQESARYRLALARAAANQFGLDAPVARLAAQIQQESAWDPRAESPYAQGLSQFTPATARWLPSVCPEVGPPDAWDPQWSLRALTCYDAWLYSRMASAADECARWAFTLSAYNGGETALDRERARADVRGLDQNRWFGEVDGVVGRALRAWRENRGYVANILLHVEPAYIDAGWHGEAACA